MEAIYLYVIKSAGILAVFYLCYLLFLQKETFFTANRWFLLLGIFASIALPTVVFTKIVWIEPEVIANEITISAVKSVPNAAVFPKVELMAATPTFEINWMAVFLIFYGTGILILVTKFISELYSIKFIIRNKKLELRQNLKLVATNQDIAPFSFFKFIVFNPNSFSNSELQNILAHEKVHCDQLHSVDVILTRLFSIVFWFNPLVWIYQKAIVQNLEFIADCGALNSVSDRKSYQFTLLKVTTHQNCVALSNPFYQSLIKKRIVMLNKNQSKKWHSWKFAIVFPILVTFMFQFQMKVVAQEKEIEYNNTEISTLIFTKTTTNEQLKVDCERVKKAHNIDLKFYKIKRNKTGEIQSITASFNDNNGSKGTKTIKSSDVIDDFIFVYEKQKNGKFQIGFQELKDAKLSPLMKEVLKIGNSSITRDSVSITKTKTVYKTPAELKTENEQLPIYYINDTIGTKKDIVNLSPDDIESFTILKPESAVEKYGQAGKYGVYEVKTKKNTKIIKKTTRVTNEAGVTRTTNFVFSKPNKKLIVIDAGHGGTDFGATVNGVSEKQIVENIANKIKLLSKNSEVKIIVIRPNDNFVSLAERAEQINEIEPDLLISLHVNMNTDTSKNGIEAYVYSQSNFYDESREKANDLLDRLSNKNLVKLGIKDARFLILRKTNCPGFMLELGHLSNEFNRNYLTSVAGQNEIANKIFQFLTE